MNKQSTLYPKKEYEYGKIYNIGRHRIMLGDCLDPDHAARLAAGVTPDLILADPPWQKTGMGFDRKFDIDGFARMLSGIMGQHTWLFLFADFVTASRFIPLFRYKFQYVWVKDNTPNMFPGTKRPYMKHEEIYAFVSGTADRMDGLYFNREALRTAGHPYTDVRAARHNRTEYQKSQTGNSGAQSITNTGYREGTSILEYPSKPTMRKSERTPHPTQKPQALIETLCRGYCKPGGTVFDLTAGSGTSVAAAHRTGRTCCAMESNPQYFEMMLSRLSRVTGTRPEETDE